MAERYKEQITRTAPSCILFLIDQSGSMSHPWGNVGKSKAEGVATVVNRLLSNVVIKCTKGEDKPRDYFHIGVMGYGFAEGGSVGSAFKGALANRELVPISEIALHPLRVEERSSDQVDAETGRIIKVPSKFPIWFDPVAVDGTPMCRVLQEARHTVEAFLKQHPGSFPPTVINVTDGEFGDGDPRPHAEALTNLVNANGSHALLFNIHISSRSGSAVTFPENDELLPDDYARILFEMSSVLPQPMIGLARIEMPNRGIGDQARGFSFNADMVEFIKFIDIGTRVGDSQMR